MQACLTTQSYTKMNRQIIGHVCFSHLDTHNACHKMVVIQHIALSWAGFFVDSGVPFYIQPSYVAPVPPFIDSCT